MYYILTGIMKKYRLQKQSPWGIYGKFAIYFALWNYIGYKLYQKMSNSARKKYPNFDELTSCKFYRVYIFYIQINIKFHLKIHVYMCTGN